MNSLTPLCSRINRIVFVIAIACFATTLRAVIFVAADSDKATSSLFRHILDGQTAKLPNVSASCR